jgi:hypothetical protein
MTHHERHYQPGLRLMERLEASHRLEEVESGCGWWHFVGTTFGSRQTA